MRKMSKADKAAGYLALLEECNTYKLVTYFWINGILPDAAEVVALDDEVQEFRLYGALRADGGTLVAIHRVDGQPASAEAIRFDEWVQRCAKLPYGDRYTDIKIACERLQAARRQIYDREIEKTR